MGLWAAGGAFVLLSILVVAELIAMTPKSGGPYALVANAFGPYPGFTPDMYEDYSQPLFGETRVLRGGGWATRGRLIRNTWRNYYAPHRNDVFAGFRTCAL